MSNDASTASSGEPASAGGPSASRDPGPTADLVLTADQLASWELLAGGWLRPASGFVGPDDVEAGLPLTLDVDRAFGEAVVGQTLGLRDPEGVLLGTMEVKGTANAPWADGDKVHVFGPQTVRTTSVRYDHQPLRLPAGEVPRHGGVGMIAPLGHPLSTDERAALHDLHQRQFGPGSGSPLYLLTLVGSASADDTAMHTLVKAHALHAERFRRAGMPVVHVVVPAPPSEGSETSPVLTRVVSALRDDPEMPVVLGHAGRDRSDAAGYDPEVGDLLRRREPAKDTAGLTVFFTGLSGSGKSTVAGAVMARLHAETDRTITLLDGDLVRQHLSSELTFSREHRDLNITRIGFVAAEVTKHRGIAICAPIAPYAATRQRVREMVQAHGTFVLVHVATPLEVCEARDRKGLYAKARAGEIASFTGISDPYEAPTDAELVIDTSEGSVADAAAIVIDHLRTAGLVPAPVDGTT